MFNKIVSRHDQSSLFFFLLLVQNGDGRKRNSVINLASVTSANYRRGNKIGRVSRRRITSHSWKLSGRASTSQQIRSSVIAKFDLRLFQDNPGGIARERSNSKGIFRGLGALTRGRVTRTPLRTVCKRAHTGRNRFPSLSYPSFHPNSSAINTERRGARPVRERERERERERAATTREMEDRKIFRGFPESPGSNFTCIEATFRWMLSRPCVIHRTGSVSRQNQNATHCISGREVFAISIRDGMQNSRCSNKNI